MSANSNLIDATLFSELLAAVFIAGLNVQELLETHISIFFFQSKFTVSQ